VSTEGIERVWATLESLDLEKILIIAVISASPIGEILIAIPIGVVMGIDPFVSYIIAFPSNMIPAAVILAILDLFEERYPSISRYFARRGEGLVRRLGIGGIKVAIIIVTPIAGVYAISFATKILGIDKRTSFKYQSIGVALYGLVEAVLISLGLSLPGRFLW
jgi:uncharacterized membrane protein